MRICVISVDLDQTRQSHKIALDLDERFNRFDNTSVRFVDLLDFHFPDIHLTHLEGLLKEADLLLFAGSVDKPIYPYPIHFILETYGASLIGKTVRMALIGRNAPEAASLLNRCLEQLKIKTGQPFVLQEISPFFDEYLHLVSEPLDDRLDEFAKDCIFLTSKGDHLTTALHLNE